MLIAYFSVVLVLLLISILWYQYRYSKRILQKKTGLAFLGEVPVASKVPRANLAMISMLLPHSPLAQAYQCIAASLPVTQARQAAQVVLVSSAQIGEGKSMVSINLAIQLAQLNLKVVLIDANLQRPSLHLNLDRPNQYGLMDYLEYGCSLTEITQVIPHMENAYVITAGAPRLDPLSLLNSQRLVSLLQRARQHFDVTILDSAAINEGIDTILLAHFVDNMLLVTPVQPWKRRAVLAALKSLKATNLAITGFILMRSTRIKPEYAYYDTYYHDKLKKKSAKKDGINLKSGTARVLKRSWYR